MFTGIVEELGEVVGLDRHGRRRRCSPCAARWSPPTPARRLDRGQRRLPHRRRRVDGDIFTADVMGETLRPLAARRAAPPASRSTWSAPPRWPPGSAGTSCRATSTASARSLAASPASSGRTSGSRCRRTWPGTWSRRARSPSTGSRSPWSRSTTTRSRSSLIPTTLELTTLGRKRRRRPGQPGGRRDRQVRREAAAQRSGGAP